MSTDTGPQGEKPHPHHAIAVGFPQPQDDSQQVAPASSGAHLRSLELGDAEDGLHDRTEVAAVAQVPQACVPWAVHRLQLSP